MKDIEIGIPVGEDLLFPASFILLIRLKRYPVVTWIGLRMRIVAISYFMRNTFWKGSTKRPFVGLITTGLKHPLKVNTSSFETIRFFQHLYLLPNVLSNGPSISSVPERRFPSNYSGKADVRFTPSFSGLEA